YMKHSQAVGFHLAFSPDSRRAAYASEDGNGHRVMVQAISGGDAKWQVSAEAGEFPAWRRDGRELYYVGPGKLMAVPVETSAGGFRAGTAEPLFEVGEGVDFQDRLPRYQP